MSSTIHKFTQSSSFCYGSRNQNGLGAPGSNNPYVLRDVLNIALSGKTPAYFANPPPIPANCDDEIVPEFCNIARLADILTTQLPLSPSVPPHVDDCMGAFDFFYTNLALTPCQAEPTIQEQLLCVLTYMSNLALVYAQVGDSPCDPVTHPMEVVVIFDNKLAISWGNMIDDGSGNLIRQMSQMPFPLNFETFSVTFYSELTKTYYSDPRGIFTA